MADQFDDIQKKMLAYVDRITGKSTGGLMKTANYAPQDNFSNDMQQYRSSFLSYSDMDLPSDYRDVFRWCRYFFKTDSLVGPAVRAMATFPVTDYITNEAPIEEENENLDAAEESPTLKFYKGVLKSDVNLYTHMLEIGYDYFGYGNCIIFGEFGTKEVKYRDPGTKEVKIRHEITWRNLERLDVTRVKIRRDPKTRKKIYYYDVPIHLKKIIKDKKPKAIYDKIPKIFIKAVQKKGLVKLKSDNIFHFSMPTESGDEGLWATPPMLHAMKLIMYTNVLRQAQEAIAYEHIIPKRVYYFQETSEFSANYNFDELASDFAGQLNRQLRDPNYQIVSPVPIQQLQHGGQGRALLLVQEIEQLQKTILSAMGIPYEFLFGGMSYSGSTVSLRFLENQFISYRTLMEEYINNFLIRRLAEKRGEWEAEDDDEKLVTVELADLKMQDDLQQKQFLFSLVQNGIISKEYFLEKGMGLDSKTINEQIQSEQQQQVEDGLENQIFTNKITEKLNQQGLNVAPQVDPNDPNAAAQPAMDPNAPQGGAQAGSIPQAKLQEFAQQLAEMEPEMAQDTLAQLDQATRAQIEPVYQQLVSQSGGGDMQNGVDMRPMPTDKPPRRQGGI